MLTILRLSSNTVNLGWIISFLAAFFFFFLNWTTECVANQRNKEVPSVYTLCPRPLLERQAKIIANEMNKSGRKGWWNQYRRLHTCKIKVSASEKGTTFNICSTSSESEIVNEFGTKFQYSEPFYSYRTISSSFGILKNVRTLAYTVNCLHCLWSWNTDVK
jgi:hypothetical protein